MNEDKTQMIILCIENNKSMIYSVIAAIRDHYKFD